MTQGQFFKRILTGLNSEFSFKTSRLTKAEEPSLPYLPIAGGRIIGYIPFSRVSVLCKMQSVSSRIWTRVTVSISYDDNHYTTGTSTKFVFIALFCAAIWRDSVSFLRFPFLSFVQVISRKISLVFLLKCPYNCFSSDFCFLDIVILLIIVLFKLPVLFLVAVIIFLCLFLRDIKLVQFTQKRTQRSSDKN